jgi:CheY-like chemotaxis protein
MSHARVLAEKILVADDDRATRFAISSMLKKAGYVVTAVKDGAEALRNIQQTSFHLAFLDIWMPELTGLEVLARVRAGESHPKIVIMTSDGTPETVLRAIREQAYEYLSKPFPPKEAVEVAQRALKQNASPPIEVISARPHWLELLIPCTREAAERIQSFLMKLEADLPDDLRDTRTGIQGAAAQRGGVGRQAGSEPQSTDCSCAPRACCCIALQIPALVSASKV